MSDRNLSAAMLDEIDNDQIQPVYLFEGEFDAGTLYLTDAAMDIVWGGNTYVTAGGLLGFSGITETGQLLVNSVTVSLAGVDTSEAIAAVLNDDFLDRPLRIYLAMLDLSSMAVVVDPLKIFEGRMDAPSIQEDPEKNTATVSVRGTPAWSDFGRKPGRHTNDEEQQFHFSGDTGFRFVSELPKIIQWGRA